MLQLWSGPEIEHATDIPAMAKSDALHAPGSSITLYDGDRKRVVYHLPDSIHKIRKTFHAVLQKFGDEDVTVQVSAMASPRVLKVVAHQLVVGSAPDMHLKTNVEQPIAKPRFMPQWSSEADLRVAAQAQWLGRGTRLAHFLATERYNPQEFTDAVHHLMKDIPHVDVAVVSAEHLPLLAAVGQGAEVPPRMLVVRYTPVPDPPTVLVGKGITFDTGGLHLKPTHHIEDMYLDKAGAAVVVGTVWALSKMGVPVPMVGVLPMAENAIGPKAVKPSALLRSFKGLTVEVGNTDAEGRLILADALAWAEKELQPARMIDVATLTGSCISALGLETAGLFSNRAGRKLSHAVRHAAKESGEAVWPLPISDEHLERVRGKTTDVINDASKGGGGASFAAAFLSRFVSRSVPWCHIDMAGPGMEQPGWGVQLLGGLLLS